MITVGIDMIPRRIGVDGFSSMSIFTTLTLSPSSPLICSTMGAIMRHGPHHVAQKSTRTGTLDFRTELSNSTSVTAWMSDIYEAFSVLESDLPSVLPSDLLSDFGSDLVSDLLSDLLSEELESEPLDDELEPELVLL